MFRSKQQRGFTLIELVIAIAIVGISTATVSKMLVSGLKLVETSTSRSEDLLQARSFYETLLAIDAESAWCDDKPPSCDDKPPSKCDSNVEIKSVDIKESVKFSDILPADSTGGDLYPLDDASCEKQGGAIIFTIPIRSDGQELKLAIPQ